MTHTTYTVLQRTNNGTRLTLTPANYGECFQSYRHAYKFAQKTRFLYGVVRTDRVWDVCRRFQEQNN